MFLHMNTDLVSGSTIFKYLSFQLREIFALGGIKSRGNLAKLLLWKSVAWSGLKRNAQ